MSRFLLSCGGTGGHLSPGIALAEGLIARGHEATLLISEKRIDARLSGKYPHLHFVAIPGAPLTGGPRGWLRFLASQSHGFFFTWRLVAFSRPAAVIGFGGFTTAGVILVAALRRIPIFLHEANRVPGKAVRKFARLACRIYLPDGVSLPGARADRIRPAGLPVRREIARMDRGEACAVFGLDPARPVVAVFAGSQGSEPLNRWARSDAAALAGAGIQLYCVTGPGNDAGSETTAPGPDGRPVRIVYSPFCDKVAALLSAANLIVARAGAGTISELVRCHTPAILVPFPQAADNHQAANAAALADAGAGVLLDQRRMDELPALVRELVGDRPRREQIADALRRLDARDPLPLIIDDIENLTGGENAPRPSRLAEST